LKLLNPELEAKIQRDITANLLQKKYTLAITHLSAILKELYAAIPDNKRISFGRVYTIQELSKYLFSNLAEANAAVYEVGSALFEQSSDFRSKGAALGILSLYGMDNYEQVLPFFESSASSPSWGMREFAQMFFRKLIQKHPNKAKAYLLKLAVSKNANTRRFVAETLRPVKENKWFYKHPDYSLSILRFLFRESSAYPRASVGNNLSDLARHLPELVFGLVKELVESGDRNSYWIAYRACRNLVKKEPARVMNLLRVDEYKYKQTVYRRSDHPRNQGKVNTA
jgi:3-methyladenine DNA glycosylase AlkC